MGTVAGMFCGLLLMMAHTKCSRESGLIHKVPPGLALQLG